MTPATDLSCGHKLDPDLNVATATAADLSCCHSLYPDLNTATAVVIQL